MFENVKGFVVENAVAIGCAAAASVVSGVAGYWFGKRKGIASVATVTIAPTATESKKEEKKDDEKGSDETAN